MRFIITFNNNGILYTELYTRKSALMAAISELIDTGIIFQLKVE